MSVVQFAGFFLNDKQLWEIDASVAMMCMMFPLLIHYLNKKIISLRNESSSSMRLQLGKESLNISFSNDTILIITTIWKWSNLLTKQ